MAKIRDEARLSQGEFAARLGVSARAYQNYERGERDVPSGLVATIYTELGVDPAWLLTGATREATGGNVAALESAVLDIRKYIESKNAKLAPEKEAKFVKTVYLHYVKYGVMEYEELANLFDLIK